MLVGAPCFAGPLPAALPAALPVGCTADGRRVQISFQRCAGLVALAAPLELQQREHGNAV